MAVSDSRQGGMLPSFSPVSPAPPSGNASPSPDAAALPPPGPSPQPPPSAKHTAKTDGKTGLLQTDVHLPLKKNPKEFSM